MGTLVFSALRVKGLTRTDDWVMEAHRAEDEISNDETERELQGLKKVGRVADRLDGDFTRKGLHVGVHCGNVNGLQRPRVG